MSIFSLDYEPLAWEPQPLGYARQGLCAHCIVQLDSEASRCTDINSATPYFVNTGMDCIRILGGRIAPDKEFCQGSGILLAPIGFGMNQFMLEVYSGTDLFDFYNYEIPRFRTAMYSYPLLRGNCFGISTKEGLWEFQTSGAKQVASYVPREHGAYRHIFDPNPLTTLYYR